MQTAAITAAVSLAAIGVFQLALALGAPLGRAAWAGQHPGVLPRNLRIASAAAAVLYPLMIVLVLASAGVIDDAAVPGSGVVAMWFLTAFFGLGVLANGASRSRPERIWAPVSLVIAVCCAIVATSA
ncbi:hypothetical protein [Nitriliruptor alkaliphilus]|uniref:hypothetical protein n=1 Tax=Nitriliruptor alkaliphilus TaxID=427918 RepID=UPI0006979720|nr:hypothetical protein [Nitriliruptor alkaliphilus]